MNRISFKDDGQCTYACLGGSATRVISDKIDMEVNQVQFSLSIRLINLFEKC